MDVTGIAKLATTMSDTSTRQQVAIAVMKKAQDAQTTSAAQLLEALPATTPAQNLPAHLGNTINTTA